MALPTKQQSLDRLCELLDLPPLDVSVGSSVPAEVFFTAARRFGVEVQGSMPLMGEAITLAAGLPWPYDLGLPASERCDSRLTPSKGGSTVTRFGLNRLREAVDALLDLHAGPTSAEAGPLGDAYRPATGGVSADPVILERDWEALDEATKAHAQLHNDIAASLQAFGVDPLSPRPGVDPPFDIGWRVGDRFYVGEVKSTTARNLVQQARLGLGQVLEYREAIRATGIDDVIAVLATTSPVGPAQLIALASAGVIPIAGSDLSAGLAPHVG